MDSGVLPAHRSLKPGSDEAHFYGLLASQGYRWSDLMYVRLVHLFDAAKRRELMIVCAKTLPRPGTWLRSWTRTVPGTQTRLPFRTNSPGERNKHYRRHGRQPTPITFLAATLALAGPYMQATFTV